MSSSSTTTTSSPTSFPLFPLLPTELRRKIILSSLPTTSTLHIKEGADLDITTITPAAPAAHMACKEAQAVYVEAGYTPYSVYAQEDWAAIHLSKDSLLQLIISPSSSPKANLNITWTELWGLLGDALLAVKKLHIVCSRPERLVRLWAAPEAGLVRPGASHWDDEQLWCGETVKTDRECRGLMDPELVVTTSAKSLEELEGSEEGVEKRGLVRERVVEGFGPEAKFSDTKVLRLVGEEKRVEVEEWEELVRDVEGVKIGDELSEKALERFVQETGWKPRSTAPSSEYSVPVKYDGELWLTVS